MQGWIKIHRTIVDHWVFQNEKFFKWWFIMLVEVNHKESEFLIGYNVHKIKRGQSCKSLRKWAELFNSNTKQVTKFFDLLEKEDMISRKTIGKMKQSTTLINIINYNDYQGGDETQTTTQVTTQEKHKLLHNRDTNKNVKNGNNEKNDNKKINTPPSFLDFKNYCLEKTKDVDLEKLELKYESWKENDWKDGHDKKIKNWKSKILNTLPYLKKEKKEDENDFFENR